MKKLFITAIITSFFVTKVNAQLYSTQIGSLSFFSKTPAKDISAESKSALAVMNGKTKELAFRVANTTFEFPNKLMQEHFNEKYIESEKYPNSSFKGKINEDIDLSKPGSYTVTVTGKLNIHGVELDRTISGVVIVKDETILLQSKFKLVIADHKIEIPKLVGAEIAEEIEITVDIKLLAKK